MWSVTPEHWLLLSSPWPSQHTGGVAGSIRGRPVPEVPACLSKLTARHARAPQQLWRTCNRSKRLRQRRVHAKRSGGGLRLRSPFTTIDPEAMSRVSARGVEYPLYTPWSPQQLIQTTVMWPPLQLIQRLRQGPLQPMIQRL